MKQRIVAFLGLILSYGAHAQGPAVGVSLVKYVAPTVGPYLEISLAIAPTSLQLLPTPEGLKGTLTGVVLVKDGDGIEVADKFNIAAGPYADSSAIPAILLNQIQLPVSPGKKMVFLNLWSAANQSDSISARVPVTIPIPSDQVPAISDLVFLNTAEKSDQKGAPFVKHGYRMVPKISPEMPVLDGEKAELTFYAEIYPSGSTKQTYGKWYLKDFSGNILVSTGQFIRQPNAPVIPILRTINASDLATGQYELVIDVLNAQGQPAATTTLPFYRKNPVVKDTEADLSTLEVPTAFAQALPPDEYLSEVIAAHSPISDQRQERLAKTVSSSDDVMLKKRFLYSFWTERTPHDPVKGFLEYDEKVKYVQEKYGTRILKGYKADRGRVYLQYGPPTMTESRPSEPSSYPYEIWQYDQLISSQYPAQTNKVFIFGLFELASKNYRLIHSTALGEMFNPNWGLQLANRTGSQIDMSEQTYDSDFTNEGSRARSNLIINGGSINQVNRR
jgi:GWxTD domain-containing protein